uniref:RNase H type-1 domain-containing protein n=1 Tax=Quercus lobata TaxID=97700 RepID=A0A7N2ME92_QUELO
MEIRVLIIFTIENNQSHVIRGILMSCGPLKRIDFSHVKRQGNRLAHLLAKHALGIADYLTWMEETPCFLEQALLHDVHFDFSE